MMQVRIQQAWVLCDAAAAVNACVLRLSAPMIWTLSTLYCYIP